MPAIDSSPQANAPETPIERAPGTLGFRNPSENLETSTVPAPEIRHRPGCATNGSNPPARIDWSRLKQVATRPSEQDALVVDVRSRIVRLAHPLNSLTSIPAWRKKNPAPKVLLPLPSDSEPCPSVDLLTGFPTRLLPCDFVFFSTFEPDLNHARPIYSS